MGILTTFEVSKDGLPLIVWNAMPSYTKEALQYLKNGYKKFAGDEPSSELLVSWKSALLSIFDVFKGYPIVIEYPILGGPERADFVVCGKRRALVIEYKDWRGSNIEERRDHLVKVDREYKLDPCYQLTNYLNKFKMLHEASEKIEFDGLVYIEGPAYRDSCKVSISKDNLEKVVLWLGDPGSEEQVRLITEGRFRISKSLIDFVKENKEKLLKDATNALLGGGYGLIEEQLKIVDGALSALENAEDKAFFVRGVSGSGKTLVALTLFFEALSKGYKAILAYKNNRLINTLRLALGSKLPLKFYSVGPRGNFQGVAEENFPEDKYGELDLVIYDEAQRMREENIKISLRRSRVKVYFYDDEQILNGDEIGTRDKFVDVAKKLEKNYVEYELPTPRRIPPMYLQAIRDLLNGREFKFEGVEFSIFDNINDMIEGLRKKFKEGHRVALICAFTETPGNKKDRNALDNLRIGYPLCKKFNMKRKKCIKSDLDIYKNTNLRIYWLMDEKTEYPQYWMGQIDPLSRCASVYGVQGFEAEYVGVIWGRDLVWRNKSWTVNSEPITDNVGGRHSLLKIARKDKERALALLKNRYLIMLTRGTKGVYIFFEDEETKNYIKSMLSKG